MSKTPKPFPAPENRLADRFSQASTPIGAIAKDPIIFRSIVDAFEAGDSKLFLHLLAELRISEYCERICAWLRSKESVLECLMVCGPPPKEPLTFEQVAKFADVAVILSRDEFLTRRLVDSVKDRDSLAFMTVVKELGAESFCHLLCHWVSIVRYRLICEIICGKREYHTYQVAAELIRAGEAIGQLVQKKKLLRSVFESAIASEVDSLNEIIGAFIDCYLICEWICSLRCVWICLPFCQAFPIPEIKDPIEEMREFAQFSEKLAENKNAFHHLQSAMQSGNSESFMSLIKEYKAERYCLQLCHWLCYEICSRWCFIICGNNPGFDNPLFTNVGDFSITSDIATSTGLTNKAAGASGHGGPNYGFFDSLSLRGFCPKYYPGSLNDSMAYRFLYLPAGSTVPIPITGVGLVSPVWVGTRYITWLGNPNTPQSIWIAGIAPPPQLIGPTPPPHYIIPDANGWVSVDPNALDNGFNGALMGFNTTIAFPGGDTPAASYLNPGQPVLPADQKNGVDCAIIFQATRVSTIAAVNSGAAPDYTNQLARIHINNWNAVHLLSLLQFAGNMSCTPVNNALDVEYTADHELMAYTYIDWVTAAAVPSPTWPNATGPRGMSGTSHIDTTSWPSCSYLIRLHTRRRLTDGLIDDIDLWENSFITFCICGH